MVYNCTYCSESLYRMSASKKTQSKKNIQEFPIVETSNSSQNLETTKQVTATGIFLKATVLAIVLACSMLLLTAVAVGIWGVSQAQTFFKASGLSYEQTKDIVMRGIANEPKHTDGVTTFLLLGLDTLETRPGSPQLTDTIMLVFVHYETGTIATLPLPRDIWSPEYKTKINALYHYGQERYPGEPERFTREVVSDLTGLKIDYTIVLTLEQVGSIIDQIGGVTVVIPEGFTDSEFPRTDVDVTVVTDPALLYETVTFEVGEQTLSGERALQYIRSRKSGDDQGDDIARGTRQQRIIEALITTLQSKRVITNPKLLGNLVKYYQDTFDSSLPLSEGISIGWALMQKSDTIAFESHTLPLITDSENGVLSNPPIRKYGLWVYEIVDRAAFKDFIASVKK